MKKTINLKDFQDAFEAAGRGEQFSYEGLGLIFDYLEEYERESGEEIELDVIAICCEIEEGTAESIARNYDIEIDDDSPEDSFHQVVDYLSGETTVIGFDADNDMIVYIKF